MKKVWSAMVLGGSLLSAVPEAQADTLAVPNAWVARFSNFRGDLACEYGDPDCNRCVNDVVAAFDKFSGSGGRNEEYFVDGAQSPGANITPEQVLAVAPGGGTHVQSFVRLPIDVTSSDAQWYAVSHGGDPKGYLWFMSVEWVPVTYPGPPSEPHNDFAFAQEMKYIYKTDASEHPGGMQGIGHYLLVPQDVDGGDGPAYLEVYDVSDPSALTRTARKQLAEPQIASVSAAKLAGGGYLLIANVTSKRGDYDYYYVNDIATLAGFEYLGRAASKYGNENLSMLTECKTGKLYVVGATGSGTYATGDNRWTLYQVSGPSNFDMTVVRDTTKGHDPECNARASGTAMAGRNGELMVYCHQKLGEGDPGWDWGACLLGGIWSCQDAVEEDATLHYREYRATP